MRYHVNISSTLHDFINGAFLTEHVLYIWLIEYWPGGF